MKKCSFGLSSLLCVVLLAACDKQPLPERNTLFSELPSSSTGIDFENKVIDDSEFNIIQYLYFYNGGGVATGDINNDELPDVYFVSNQGPNRLYLNRGGLRFEDITFNAGVAGSGNWKTGVTMADLNGDSYLDIFVCGVGGYKGFNSKNQLFINNGDLTFSDKTQEYGLDFHGFSTHAAFFDYDIDGDLDMYLLNHSVHTSRSYGDVWLRFEIDKKAGDKLYKNSFFPDGKVFFEEVTTGTNILSSQIGYGLGVGISDLNFDGYPDIYVSNDFHENDYLYINQRDGTFSQVLEKSIGHTSRFSMGNDIADINNDGWTDIVVLDMLPKDETIIKASAGDDPFDIFQYKLQFGYHYQYSKNTLQLNRGVASDVKYPKFSEIAPLAGVEATDWSWSPLLADFDNDGYKDLVVTNGIVKRPNDLDYINYLSSDLGRKNDSDLQLIKKMPPGTIPNYIFRNNQDLTFSDVSEKWIGKTPSISSGSSYSDLDNDGDLDLLVNNINQKAFVYRNNLSKNESRFIKIVFDGKSGNNFGIGSKVLIYSGSQILYYEQFPSRGWQSAVETSMNIGLGTLPIDSVTVIWPNGMFETVTNVEANQTMTFHQVQAKKRWEYHTSNKQGDQFLSKESNKLFTHREDNFAPYNSERLIPRAVCNEGPRISTGDINNDGLEDFFIGGGKGQAGGVFMQNRKKEFKRLRQPAIENDSLAEDTGSTFFDADDDGDLDLIVVGGGQEADEESELIMARMYLNKGNGIFDRSDFPDIRVHSSCVEAADFDHDGDNDLFIGGRVIPLKYGVSPKSFLLRNNGRGKFEEVTGDLIGSNHMGMITDASWSDANADGRLDLILVGEWMPVTIFIQNENGSFTNQTQNSMLENYSGWWNVLESCDLDRDGDIDFIVGNLGLNSRLRSSMDRPVRLFVGDFDSNDGTDHILTYYNGIVEYPFVSRDKLIRQIPHLKKKFNRSEEYKSAQIQDILSPDQMAEALVKEATYFQSALILNNGDGTFIISALPVDAQISPVFGIAVADLNRDSHEDIILGGNMYLTQPEFGRYDASNGTVLLGDGHGNFSPVHDGFSGFDVSGEIRDIKIIKSGQKAEVVLVSRNHNSLEIYSLNHTNR